MSDRASPGHPSPAIGLWAWVWVGAAVLLRSSAAVFAKGAALAGVTTLDSVRSPLYAAALVCLFLQALSWTMALRKIPLTLAYPFMSAVLGLNLLAAHMIFGERIALGHLVGVGLAGLGIVVLSLERPAS